MAAPEDQVIMNAERVAELLKDINGEWTLRKSSLEFIQTLVLSSSYTNEFILSYITSIQPLICIQLDDRRSIYCKEVCNLITSIANRLGGLFEPLSTDFITALFPLLVVTVKIIAESAHKCILSLLIHCTASIPVISQGTKDKHPIIRARCTEYMCRLVETASPDKLNSSINLEAIDESIRTAIADSSADARALAKRSYQAFNKRFPEHASKLLSSLDSFLQNRLVEAKPAPKKGGFADFMKKQAASKTNVSDNVLLADDVVISKTTDDNDKDGDNSTSPSSSSPSGASSPTITLSSSSSSTSNTTTSSSSNSPPSTQSHTLSDIIVLSPTEPISMPDIAIPNEFISFLSKPIITEAVAERPASSMDISTPLSPSEVVIDETTTFISSFFEPVETIPKLKNEISSTIIKEVLSNSAMEISPPSPSVPLKNNKDNTNNNYTETTKNSTLLSATLVEPQLDISEQDTKLQIEPELANFSDNESQSSSNSDVIENKPAISELLSETIERVPSPLAGKKSIEEKKPISSFKAPVAKPPTKATTKSLTKSSSLSTITTKLNAKSSSSTTSSTATIPTRALRSLNTNVSKSNETIKSTKPTLQKESSNKNVKALAVSKKTTRPVEDKENQSVGSSSPEPTKLKISSSVEVTSIAGRVKSIRRAAAVVATDSISKSILTKSSSSYLSSSSRVFATRKTMTTTAAAKRPWL